jgi:hypothetical protein
MGRDLSMMVLLPVRKRENIMTFPPPVPDPLDVFIYFTFFFSSSSSSSLLFNIIFIADAACACFRMCRNNIML